MRLPGWSADMEQGKEKLAGYYQALEMRVLNECAGLAKSGFADERVAANAYSKFEEAFLLLRKALRIKAELSDPNEYGKKSDPNPLRPESFTPRVDPYVAPVTGRGQQRDPSPPDEPRISEFPFPPLPPPYGDDVD